MIIMIIEQIEDGEVHASLDQAEGMVSFVENPEHYNSLAMVHHMEKQLQISVALQKKLTTFDKQLALDPRYANRVSFNICMVHDGAHVSFIWAKGHISCLDSSLFIWNLKDILKLFSEV